MKKRVLSALMAVGLACSLVVTAFATADVSATPAPTAAVESQNTETESSDPAAEADPTETPAETPAATQEPSPAPEESTPAPSEEPASSATPEPTAEPSAAPDDTVTATPTPTPEATTAPTPEATEEPAAAEPTAEPEATAEPAADNSADGIEYTAALEQDGQALNVIVTAPADAFSEDVSLEVAAIEDTDETDAIAAELDESGVTYDGFAALDISFKDAAGEEVEPSAPVTVRIELPDSIVDSGIDLNTLAVQHLAEDADGSVTKVEQVASVADNTITLSEEAQAAMEAQAAENAADDTATTDEAAGVAPMMLAANNALTDATAEAAAVAEFEVSGFSTFTITWSFGRTTYFEITVHYVDEKGEEIQGPREDTYYGSNDTISNNGTITFDEEYAGTISGYTYQGARYGSEQGAAVVRMVASSDGRWNPTYYLSFYSTATGTGSNDRVGQLSYDTGSWFENKKSAKIYLVYQKQAGLNIIDNITSSGEFVATFDDEIQQQINKSGATVTYQWERSLNGTNWETVQSVVVTDDKVNWEENSPNINVVYDAAYMQAADDDRYYYRVTATVTTPEDVSDEYVASEQVPYYIQLQNGSFETPEVPNGAFNQQVANGTQGLIWETTGLGKYNNMTGHDVEIIEEGHNDTQSNYGVNVAAEGNQFAELNCEAYGALYQDVLTVPDSTLNWSFDHLARNLDDASLHAKDEMALVIMPADEAGDVARQLREAAQSENPSEAIGNILDDLEEKGYFVKKHTGSTYNDIGDWETVEGTYTVPEDQYLTRFFFVSVKADYDNRTGTGSKYGTVGNLIDDVWFSTKLKPVVDGETRLVLTKTVSNLEDLPEDYSVTFQLSDGTQQQEVTFPNDDVVFSKNEDGTYTASSTFTYNVPANGGTKEITVTERDASLAGYTVATTYTVDGGTSQSGNSTEVTLTEKETTVLNFTNTYTALEPLKPAHRKYIEDNGNGTYDLTLDVTGTVQTEGGEDIKLDILYVLDNSSSMAYSMEGGGSRLSSAKNAIGALESVLKENDSLDVQHSLVVFSGYNTKQTNYIYTHKDWCSINKSLNLNGVEANGNGTNYQEGLQQAIEQLDPNKSGSTIRADAEQIVIFLSDGEPNLYEENHSHADEGGAKKAALTEIKNLSADRFYAIGVGGDITTLRDLVNAASGVTGDKNYWSSTQSSGLEQIFRDMASAFTSVDCKDVVITDTLSKYAELADNATFRVAVTNAYGTAVNVTESPVTIDEASATGGKDVRFQSGNGQEITLNVKYTGPVEDAEDNGTFTLTFQSGYALEDGWTYSITTTIEPTQTAIDDYRDNIAEGSEGYDGVVGDEGTDADGNDTSSGKPGFHSNSSATLTYTSNGQTPTINYDHPVIQVPETASLTIQKVVEGLPSGSDSEVDSEKFTFTITGPAAAYNEQPVGGYSIAGTTEKVIFSLDNAEGDTTGTGATATVTVTGDNSITIDGLPAGTYTVTEDTESMDNIVDDYHFAEVTYAVNDDVSNTVTLEAAGTGTVVATNRYEHNDVTLTVNKTVTGPMGDTSTENKFTFTLTTNEPISADDNPSLSNGMNVDGMYQYTFELAHNGTIDIVVPYGAEVTVLEEDRTDYTEQVRKYETEGEGEGTFANGNTVTIETMDTDYTVDFQNFRDVVPPTGLESNHTTPYGLMVGAAGVAGAALVGSVVVRRRRRRQE